MVEKNVAISVRFLMNDRLRQQMVDVMNRANGAEAVLTVDEDLREIVISSDRGDICDLNERPRWHEETTIRPIKLSHAP